MLQQTPFLLGRWKMENIVFPKKLVMECLLRMKTEISKQKDYLTELEAQIGDSDHGVNLDRGFAAVGSELPALENKCIGEIIKKVGLILMSKVGGAAGALYGTAFMFAGKELTGKESLTKEDVLQAFAKALEGIKSRGGAVLGDKTIVDTLEPVVKYLKENPGDIETGEGWVRITEVARQGMETTRDLVAKKGRAGYLGERSRGHLDPGAVSCFFLIRSIGEEKEGELKN